MSIELLLDRFGQPNKFRKISKKKISNIVLKTCFGGPLREFLKASWGRPESTSQGRPIDVRLGRPLNVISARPQDVRSRRLWDVPGIMK